MFLQCVVACALRAQVIFHNSRERHGQEPYLFNAEGCHRVIPDALAEAYSDLVASIYKDFQYDAHLPKLARGFGLVKPPYVDSKSGLGPLEATSAGPP